MKLGVHGDPYGAFLKLLIQIVKMLRLLTYYKWNIKFCVTKFEIIYAALTIWFELASRDKKAGSLEILCFSYTKIEVYI